MVNAEMQRVAAAEAALQRKRLTNGTVPCRIVSQSEVARVCVVIYVDGMHDAEAMTQILVISLF